MATIAVDIGLYAVYTLRMDVFAQATSLEDILWMRNRYRREMNCQIVHDSLHSREGWAHPYLLSIGGAVVGYGAVAVGGPWKEKHAIFEFYVLPQLRSRVFDLFQALLKMSGAAGIDAQTNDVLLTVMLHTYARGVTPERILFHDEFTTAHAPPNAVFRRATSADAAQMQSHELDAEADWVVEAEGTIAAAGGILHHYNPPYGDLYMKVAEPFRRRGLGAFLVQELKRICYEQGKIPAARCRPANIPSRKTLQKAGFVPCGHILIGSVAPELIAATP